MPKMLITGATGLLGSNLIRQAVDSYEVIGWAKSSANLSAKCAADWFDLTNPVLTLQRLRERRPDTIVHCAAMTDVELCERDGNVARAINVDATRTLAQWCAEQRTYLVFISTDSVFDGQGGHYHEDDVAAPVNEYARTKLAAEEAARERHPGTLILRTNFYGWSCKRKLSLSEWMLGKLVRRERIDGFADIRFNPLLVNDLSRVILDLIARRATGIFHVGARNECTKYEFALSLAQVFGLDAGEVSTTSMKDGEFNARRPKNTTLVVDKITRVLGREMPSVEEGLQSFKELLESGYVAALKGKAIEQRELLNAR